MKPYVAFLLLIGIRSVAQDSTAKVPFEGMDLSWINGQNRQKDFPLTLKSKEGGEVFGEQWLSYYCGRPAAAGSFVGACFSSYITSTLSKM